MPTLNERIGLEQIFKSIPKALFDRIVVVDAWSTDGTIEWCRQNDIEVFPQTIRGLRQGLNEFISTLGPEVSKVITFSPDGNCDPTSLERFVSQIKCHPNARLFIGSRYGGGATSQDDDLITAFGNRSFTKMCNLLFRANFTDVFSIYRAFDPKLISDLALNENNSYSWLEKIFATRVPWEPLMSFRAAKYKITWVDVPVGEPKRIGGERKLQMFRWGASFFLQLVREIWYRPKTLNLQTE